jgi:hypothetical protein
MGICPYTNLLASGDNPTGLYHLPDVPFLDIVLPHLITYYSLYLNDYFAP